jgi:hypothetical protein
VERAEQPDDGGQRRGALALYGNGNILPTLLHLVRPDCIVGGGGDERSPHGASRRERR